VEKPRCSSDAPLRYTVLFGVALIAAVWLVFTRQMTAFDKHRGTGEQKITVAHVNVHDGRSSVTRVQGNAEV